MFKPEKFRILRDGDEWVLILYEKVGLENDDAGQREGSGHWHGHGFGGSEERRK